MKRTLLKVVKSDHGIVMNKGIQITVGNLSLVMPHESPHNSARHEEAVFEIIQASLAFQRLYITHTTENYFFLREKR